MQVSFFSRRNMWKLLETFRWFWPTISYEHMGYYIISLVLNSTTPTVFLDDGIGCGTWRLSYSLRNGTIERRYCKKCMWQEHWILRYQNYRWIYVREYTAKHMANQKYAVIWSSFSIIIMNIYFKRLFLLHETLVSIYQMQLNFEDIHLVRFEWQIHVWGEIRVIGCPLF